jgi:transposase
VGWGWKRAKLVAKDTDPNRLERFARIRWVFEHLQVWEARIFVDELAMHFLPKAGAAWMPKGTQLEVMTPGQKEQHYLAGGLDVVTGKLMHCLGARKTNALFRERLDTIARTSPAAQYRRLDVVVDHDTIHQAKAVLEWLATHPRMVLVFLPTSCPRANPIERACGDVHDKCTRNHPRKRLRDVLQDVQRPLQANGPWRDKLSQLYYDPDVTAVVETMTAERLLPVAA